MKENEGKRGRALSRAVWESSNGNFDSDEKENTSDEKALEGSNFKVNNRSFDEAL